MEAQMAVSLLLRQQQDQQGAELNAFIVIVLGFANLLVDGFAMSVGAYLSTKSEIDNFHKHERTEYWEVENIPETERQEIR